MRDFDRELKDGVGRHLREANWKFNDAIALVQGRQPEYRPTTAWEALGALFRSLNDAFEEIVRQISNGYGRGGGR